MSRLVLATADTDFEQRVRKRPQVEAGSADDDNRASGGTRVRHARAGLIRPPGGRVPLARIGDIDSAVRDARLVAHGRLRGAEIEPTVDLSRVGAQDDCAMAFRELDGER